MQAKFELVLLTMGPNGPEEQILHGEDIEYMLRLANNYTGNDKFLQATLYFVEPKAIRSWSYSDKQKKEENNNAN